MARPQTGDIRFSGYPTSHVYSFSRNSKNKLVFAKMKHLLWGDWVKVTDFDYRVETPAPKEHVPDIRTTPEEVFVDSKLAEIEKSMVPVRVRGVSGYMKIEDLSPNRLLEVIFIDVGQGDGAVMITPDNKKYVIDAGKGDNMYRYLKWRFAGFKASNDFDGFIITHPDNDHYLGFQDIVEDDNVSCDQIYHNGLVEQFKIDRNGKQSSSTDYLLGSFAEKSGQKFLTDLIKTDGELSDLLAEQKAWIKTSSGRAKQFPNLLNTAQTATNSDGRRRFPNISNLSTEDGELHDGLSYLPGFGPDNPDGCEIRIVGPVIEEVNGQDSLRVFDKKPKEKTTSMNSGKTKNGHSILLKLQYKNLRLLFGGDLNSSAEMFLLKHYTGKNVFDKKCKTMRDAMKIAADIFEVDVAKSCHHGSADFKDEFLEVLNATATVISSGDEESHAHPRCDTLGAIGRNGYGERPLVFSTELSRSAKEFINKEDTPWFQAAKIKGKIEAEKNLGKKAQLQEEFDRLDEESKVKAVTSYGAINLRSDGERVVMAYMKEKASRSSRWDVYSLEINENGVLEYLESDLAEKREAARRKAIS
ncbi:hypothetical protein N9W89_08615 [Hellea sp.]|nr:hypothetical protein [Hellea sp.]